VLVKLGPKLKPPNPKAAVCVPAPFNEYLAVPKFPPDVQLVPPYSSVAFDLGFEPGYPPNPKPAVCVPAPPIIYLAAPKFPPVAQLASPRTEVLKLVEVELYQTCPRVGAGGSPAILCIGVPFDSL